MTPMPATRRRTRGGSSRAALLPVAVGATVGTVTGIALSVIVLWQAAVLLGWDLAAGTYLAMVWAKVGRLDPAATEQLATREDPSTRVADSVTVLAGTACLAAVGLVLVKAASSSGAAKALLIAVGVLSVALSWAAVHTVFMLKYARLFYGGGRGIDFNQKEPPDYLDFAYVAFTIGLTFQVSDTDLCEQRIRRTALRQALLAFLFGAVIVGLTINVVASLLK